VYLEHFAVCEIAHDGNYSGVQRQTAKASRSETEATIQAGAGVEKTSTAQAAGGEYDIRLGARNVMTDKAGRRLSKPGWPWERWEERRRFTAKSEVIGERLTM
jgi:hypothetical protein